MSRKTDIADDAELEVGTQYFWDSFGQGGMPDWLYKNLPHNQLGLRANTAINCFDFVIMLAIRRGYINKAQVGAIYQSVVANETEKGFASTTRIPRMGWLLNNWVWQDWPNPFGTSTTVWRPRRGDVVFLTETGGGNHVVLSLGPNARGEVEVVSFGEGLTAPARVKVNRMTIQALRDKHKRIDRVSFVDPVWS